MFFLLLAFPTAVTFWASVGEVKGDCRRLHNEELQKLYLSPDIIQVIKSVRMRQAGNVACIRKKRNVYGVLVVSMQERDHLKT
jgi:hypothetical protein